MTETKPALKAVETPQPVVPADNDLAPPQEATLAEKVSAAQARIAERTAPARAKAMEQTKAAAGDAKKFVKEHPLIAVSGTVAIGALIALSLPGKPGRKVRGSVMSAGGLLAELAATYGGQMMALAQNAAEGSRDKLGEWGERVAETGGHIAHEFAERGEGTVLTARQIAEKAAMAARHASEDAGHRTRTLTSRFRR